MMLLATHTQGPWLLLRLPFSEACPRTSESLTNSCVALNHPGTLARGLDLGGGGARARVYRVGRPAWRHRARGGAGAGAGPGRTSVRGGRAASRSNPAPGLRAAPGALCLGGPPWRCVRPCSTWTGSWRCPRWPARWTAPRSWRCPGKGAGAGPERESRRGRGLAPRRELPLGTSSPGFTLL